MRREPTRKGGELVLEKLCPLRIGGIAVHARLLGLLHLRLYKRKVAIDVCPRLVQLLESHGKFVNRLQGEGLVLRRKPLLLKTSKHLIAKA